MSRKKKVVVEIDPCALGFVSTPTVDVPIIIYQPRVEKIKSESVDFANDDLAYCFVKKT